MKRNTPNHPKTKSLARALSVEIFGAVGILEMLWHFTAQYSPAGDIGRWSNEEIANAVGWDSDADVLVNALIATRWLNSDDQHRLIVHDWRDHADDATHVYLARHGERFSDNSVPNMTKLNERERSKAVAAFEAQNAQNAELCAQHTHNVRTVCAQNAHKCALPMPMPMPMPMPLTPLPPPRGGGVS